MKPIEIFRTHLRSTLIGRDNEIDACILALSAGEHAFLLGPPGTGKSMLINNVITACQATSFRLLMGAFTTPEEIFGPFKLTALQQDQYLRNLAGRICEAETAFLDEIFKSSGAALNSLLTLMQERAFDNDGTRVDCPLRTLFAASNEMPDPDANLGALYDRFAIRVMVDKLPNSLHQKLWWGKLPAAKSVCTLDDFKAVGVQAKQTTWTSDAQEVFGKIYYSVEQSGVTIGDRRALKAISVCQTQAAIEGAKQVLPHHLECLRFVFWESTDQVGPVTQIVMREANPDQALLLEFIKEIESISSNMPRTPEQASPVYVKVGDMIEKCKGMRQSGKRDTVLRELIDLSATVQSKINGINPELAKRLMGTAAKLPPVPVPS